MRIGMPELLVILAIVVVLFGAKRLPDLGSGLAKSIKGFREGIADEGKDAGKPESGESKPSAEKDAGKTEADSEPKPPADKPEA